MSITTALRRANGDRAITSLVVVSIIGWGLWHRFAVHGRFTDTVSSTACIVATDIATGFMVLAPQWLRITFWTAAIAAVVSSFLASFA